MRIYLLILTLLCFTGGLAAQNNSFHTSVFTGLSTPLLDNGLGVHLGVNPAWSFHPHFAVEGQASYVYTQIYDTFLSGESGSTQAANLLIGIRYDVLAPGRKWRPYLNVMGGFFYQHERTDPSIRRDETGYGFSAGLYTAVSQFLFGLVLETPGHMQLRVGYRFGKP